MNNLIRLLRRYRVGIYFLLLETLSLIFFFTSTPRRNAQAGLFLRRYELHFEERISAISSYLKLKGENVKLTQENLNLRNRIEELRFKIEQVRRSSTSGYELVPFQYLEASVVSNTISRQHNFFTLNRGRQDGVTTQMGVLSHGNVIGTVVAVSAHFATAISLLNVDYKLSAKLARSGYVGSLHWDGESYHTTLLSDIPHHVDVRLGDSVVTSGFSNIFPAGELIGTVQDIERRGGDFLTLRVQIAADFKRLGTATIIQNRQRQEIDSLAQISLSHAQ